MMVHYSCTTNDAHRRDESTELCHEMKWGSHATISLRKKVKIRLEPEVVANILKRMKHIKIIASTIG